MTEHMDGRDWVAELSRPPLEAVPENLPGRWWVAHTRPRNEKSLACDLHKLSVPHYLPLCRRTTRSKNSGRVSKSILPVFTGYLFFNGDDDARVAALTTNRIVSTLLVTDQGALIRELRHIQHLLSSGSEFQWGPAIKVGDWARVVAGPLTGLEGIVQGRLSRMRLVLNVNMLSQSVSVEVPQEFLERISHPPERSF